MRRQALRMREIVEDLLELSRLEATTDEAPMAPVDVPELLSGSYARLARQRPAAPHFELDIDDSFTLRGSETELHSIASNLISNAVKYTPVDGTITIRWAREAGGSQLVVRDTGHRHRARAPAAPDRALLPRGPCAGTRQGRFRARAFDRQARPAAAWRPARDRERRGPRLDCSPRTFHHGA